MAVSAEAFAAELRAFDGRRQIVKSLRRALARAARPAVRDVRAHAIETLPSSGGLGRWTAAASMTTQIRYAGRAAGIRMRGRRKSMGDRSDLEGLDAGMIRHPSWGRRGRGQWHPQVVPAGWWTDPLAGNQAWREESDRAVDAALDTIRRG